MVANFACQSTKVPPMAFRVDSRLKSQTIVERATITVESSQGSVRVGDPISQFATKWKEANPDPTLGSVLKHKEPILARKGGG